MSKPFSWPSARPRRRLGKNPDLADAAREVLNYAGMDEFLDDPKHPQGAIWGITKRDLKALRSALVIASAPAPATQAVSRVLHHTTLTDEREVSPGVFVGRDVKDGHLRAYTAKEFIGYVAPWGDEFLVEFCADSRSEWKQYKRSTREAAEKLLEAKAKEVKL